MNVGTAPYVFFTANGTVNSKQVVFTTHGNVTEGTTFRWDFGDNRTSTERNPTHTYAAAGTYNVTMSASNNFGTFNYTLRNVSITDTLKADFTAANNQGSAPLRVNFTDATVGAGAGSGYLWNFGDGTTSTERNPVKVYNRTGTYTVALTVTNPCGATDSILKTGFVSVGAVPVADFTGTPTSGVSPLNVSFTDRSQGQNLTYRWDFGDNRTSTERNPNHTYTAAGTYTVRLTVTNEFGNNTATKERYITVGTAPRANFSADVLSGVAPHPVQFTDLSAGNPTSWHWDFGDGQTSTVQNPRHVYQRSGHYNVTLTVKNAYGESQLQRLGNGQEIWTEDQQTAVPPIPPEPPAGNDSNQSGNGSDDSPQFVIPGFGMLLAIAALLGLVGLGAYSRRRSNK
ncbi:MAG: PKD domain-containing protein [Methanosarcinales archaeon]|nr:PKD domain-containing protein [Methanosarcinales archaeon]